ncbi:hypothetical protein LAZ67_7002237 [Cordylochernes scorpioides]|uniref:Uncharacterized protein n=1 Tax=Cordylochernes scorpioides TaxID=51811 RepID=A0ABY6KNI8_9ARAC|nr:hypothetical protein LAZ67_7002237 [Cordylochernes scorpioides]
MKAQYFRIWMIYKPLKFCKWIATFKSAKAYVTSFSKAPPCHHRRFIIEKISGNTVVPISRRYVRARQSYSNLFKGYTLRCGDFTMEQKLKQRICIEFCVKLQI